MKAYLDKKKKEKKQVKEESHSPFTTPELQRKKKIEDFKKNLIEFLEERNLMMVLLYRKKVLFISGSKDLSLKMVKVVGSM